MKARIKKIDYVGKYKKDAEAFASSQGLTTRTSSEDGKHFVLTRDVQDNRLNFEVEDGVVVAVNVG